MRVRLPVIERPFLSPRMPSFSCSSELVGTVLIPSEFENFYTLSTLARSAGLYFHHRFLATLAFKAFFACFVCVELRVAPLQLRGAWPRASSRRFWNFSRCSAKNWPRLPRMATSLVEGSMKNEKEKGGGIFPPPPLHHRERVVGLLCETSFSRCSTISEYTHAMRHWPS